MANVKNIEIEINKGLYDTLKKVYDLTAGPWDDPVITEDLYNEIKGVLDDYVRGEKQPTDNATAILPDVSNRAGEFAVWLNTNRWFTYEKGKWHYTFEHGTAMSAQSYEKNYMKTHEELYAIFCKEHGY